MCQKNSSHPYLLRHSSPTPGLNSSVITRQAIVSASILLCCFDLAVCWAIGVLTPGFSQKPLPSAFLDPEIIDNKLAHDLKLGRVVEVRNPTCSFISSSLSLVRKHDGGFRKIHHLSFPNGSSVNNYIAEEACLLSYTSLHDIFHKSLVAGRHAVLIKRLVYSLSA